MPLARAGQPSSHGQAPGPLRSGQVATHIHSHTIQQGQPSGEAAHPAHDALRQLETRWLERWALPSWAGWERVPFPEA